MTELTFSQDQAVMLKQNLEATEARSENSEEGLIQEYTEGLAGTPATSATVDNTSDSLNKILK